MNTKKGCTENRNVIEEMTDLVKKKGHRNEESRKD